MGGSVRINGLNRDELNPKLYDLVSELKDKFCIPDEVFVIIQQDRSFKPNMWGGATPALNKFPITWENELKIDRGALKRLLFPSNEAETKAILAHELSHISHKDLFYCFFPFFGWFVSIIFAILLSIEITRGNLFLCAIFVLLDIVLIGRIVMWNLRRVEKRADKESVIFNKDPDALQRALTMIHVEYKDVKHQISLSGRALYQLKRVIVFLLGATHPTIEKRLDLIEALQKDGKIR
jgi:Zn-dependent protease with chaperone function